VSLVRQEMEGSMDLKVPMKASVETGPNWLEMEKV